MKNAKYDINKEKIQIEKDGKTIACDILFTFDSEDTLKSYIGYTDNSVANNGRKNIYVSAYDPLSDTQELENIVDKRELEMIAKVLASIEKDNN